MSLTQWFTRSWPTVSCFFAAMATAIFVPTPSVDAHSSGFFIPAGARISPPNPPNSPTTSFVQVASIAVRADSIASAFASMSTPACLYVVPPRFFAIGANVAAPRDAPDNRRVDPEHGAAQSFHVPLSIALGLLFLAGLAVVGFVLMSGRKRS